ncbi:S8 family serine peptidase [Egicoccus sp. AB-alg6-2]|uniref:S8 family serine peptidase n=1 Tax=Egicoccus sp. AB-alg6-2 TaxID=3242692 RepID=UPI00359E7CDF
MRGSRKFVGPAFLVGALVAAMAAPASAAGPRVEPTQPMPWELADRDGEAEFVDDLWFVEFEAAPTSRGGSRAAQNNERNAFRAEARAEGLRAEQQKDFRTLWNGMTVRADAAEAGALSTLRSVKAVYPVALVERPEPTSVSPELGTALGMTGADAAQSELGLTGEGLSVAIIDTGIDYNHPDLGGEGDDANRIEADASTRAMDHPRITHGWDYVGETFNPADPDAPQTPQPDPDPRDTQGHGSHVAGIVGASAADEDGVTGVAPGVTFGAYKVFGPGSTTSDVIVEALEHAYLDGMDIVNMSLGAAFAWGQDYPTTAASNTLAANGVVVVNSAGNSGGDGLWTLSAPANAHDIISVASADNTHVNARAFVVEQLDDPVPYMEMTGAELPPTEGESEELVWLGRACTATEGDTLEGDPAGKVALITRGTCTFAEKYEAAADAGATGVIIHNNAAGLFAGTVGDDGRDGIWSAGISLSSGEALRELLTDGETVTLQFTDEQVTAVNPTGGLASSFTSYGQDVELAFGPSVMAPGGLIVSTYPLGRGGYASLSGTSMAAPHVAGAVALLLEAEPDLDPFAVRDRLQNTAEPAEWSLAPGFGYLEHTFRQGAGMIQVDQAVLADQSVAPAQLALRDAAETVTELLVTNRGDESVTYAISHEGALSLAGSTFTPSAYLPGSELTAPDTVVVPAGATVPVPVAITAPGYGAANHQYGGYVVLTPDDEHGQTLRVPYVGFDGDYVGEMGLLGHWQNPSTFAEVDPVMARSADGGLVVAEPDHVYRPAQGDHPVVAPFFGHFPQRLELWASKVGDDERFLVGEHSYVPRSPQPGVRRTFAWDGRVARGSSGGDRMVPSGEYTLELRVLRATGDAGNADHWETWESDPFRMVTGQGRPGQPGGGPRG